MQQTTNVNDSVHNCFFCYERRRASLEEEISFFELRLGSNRTSFNCWLCVASIGIGEGFLFDGRQSGSDPV